jgi:MerR family transcriptional regulator, light-induced transcriptional regulator
MTLTIGDLVERTGVSEGTLRMWERRHGFPAPERLPSGHRRYGESDVELVQQVVRERAAGLSLAAAIGRTRESAGGVAESIFAGLRRRRPDLQAIAVRKPHLLALSHAIEDESCARAERALLFGAFQRERFYRHVERRYQRLAMLADAAFVFADFAEPRVPENGPIEVPVGPQDALANEWAVIIDAPGYAACLLGWEHPAAEPAVDGERRFEAIWTLDPRATRRAAQVAVALASREVPEEGGRVEAMLADRPLAIEEPAPSLTALTNRLVAYLEP